jgi:hypothetical protein
LAAPVFVTGDIPSASQVNSWFVNILYARKTADETVTASTTLQNDDHLSVSVAANATYHVMLEMQEVSPPAAAFKMGFTGPAGYSINGTARGAAVSISTLADFITTEVATGSNYAFGGLVGVDLCVSMNFILITSGTAGTLQVQWAQNTSNAGGTTVRANSFMLLRQVA